MTTDMTERSVTRHVLTGLRPEPLARYLAGLGVIRLIAEQADPGATARWSPDGLVIETTVADIANWLAAEYVPTPVLSPWNGGSGFGAKDVEPKRRLARLLADESRRLAGFRAAMDAATAAMRKAVVAGWIKEDSKGDSKIVDKQRLVQDFRNRCPDALLPWVDACVVLTSADRSEFPPLLGTGGNDGRLDFSTNFHEQLLVVLDGSQPGRARSVGSARDLLSGGDAERLANAPVGQFDPAGAGGQASSPFGAAASLVNPWEYVLLVEGALLFAAGVARRNQHGAGRAAMPFTVAYSPDGSVSGAAGEQSRGEVWVPVWSSACTLAEIVQLFSEARASWRGRPARRAVDFYAATRSLGVARGVGQFVRYGLQQRNGLAFVAVPLDRVEVADKPEVRLAARIEDWVSWIPRGEASRALGTCLRRFEAAHLRYARDGGALALRDLLAALTSLELAVGRSGRIREQVSVRTPPPATRFLSVLAAERESAELRLAVGIASCATWPGRNGAPARSMRHILLPLDPGDPADRAHRAGRWRDTALAPGLGVRPLRHVLADVLAWRSRTAADEAPIKEPSGGSCAAQPSTGKAGPAGSSTAVFRGTPAFRRGIRVPYPDLHAFAAWPAGSAGTYIDDDELGTWLLACLALDWRGTRARWSEPQRARPIPTLALLHPFAEGLAERGNPAGPPLALAPDWAVRLAAGQVAGVHADAVRRLRQAGWEAVPTVPLPDSGQLVNGSAFGTSLAAALVPRCAGGSVLLETQFAIKIKPDLDSPGKAMPAGYSEGIVTPQLTEELS